MKENEIIEVRCSSLPRLAMCPGSFEASKGIENATSAVAESGTRTHKAIEDYYVKGEFSAEGLEEREEKIATWFIAKADAEIERHGGAVRIEPELKMMSMLTECIRLTGHADLVVHAKDGSWLLFDWKTGYLEVPVAAANTQLKGYAVLLARTVFKHEEAGDIHALLFSSGNEEALTGTVYTPENIAKATEHILAIIIKAVDPDAKRYPSDGSCVKGYCLAQGSSRCPERLDNISQLPVLTQPYEILPSKEKCLELFKAVKTVEAFGRKFQSDLKAAVNEDPEAWSHIFEMSNTGSTRNVLDAQAAYATFVEEEELMTHDEFMSTLKVAIGKLEKACKPGLKEQAIKAKDQKKHIEGLLGSNLEKKDKSKSLKVVKS